jgi:PAS domain-containing protein
MPTRRIADLILESATDYAIITTDLTRDITFWNSGDEKVLCWSELEVRGNRPVLYIHRKTRLLVFPRWRWVGR